MFCNYFLMHLINRRRKRSPRLPSDIPQHISAGKMTRKFGEIHCVSNAKEQLVTLNTITTWQMPVMMESPGNASQDSSRTSGIILQPRAATQAPLVSPTEGEEQPLCLLTCLRGADKMGNFRSLIQNCVFLFSCLLAVGSDKADHCHSGGEQDTLESGYNFS